MGLCWRPKSAFCGNDHQSLAISNEPFTRVATSFFVRRAVAATVCAVRFERHFWNARNQALVGNMACTCLEPLRAAPLLISLVVFDEFSNSSSRNEAADKIEKLDQKDGDADLYPCLGQPSESDPLQEGGLEKALRSSPLQRLQKNASAQLAHFAKWSTARSAPSAAFSPKARDNHRGHECLPAKHLICALPILQPRNLAAARRPGALVSREAPSSA
jgi:hypothetical protein